MGNLSRNVKAARNKREWTQEELSQCSGVQACEISRIEAGKRDPRVSTVEKLARALGLSPGRLLD